MGSMHEVEMGNFYEQSRKGKGDASICQLLSTLPPNTTVAEILVDGLPFAVSAFVNLNTDTKLAYFTSVVGTTLIVDCDSISQVIF
ncbi:hypothetical protein [Sporosarcina koreensis]|uniref:Spore germination protein PD n=1 Tax=Sporosarcina koreensis TaxID=334735 RepID=A0ABW0U277_9BACL